MVQAYVLYHERSARYADRERRANRPNVREPRAMTFEQLRLYFNV